jgi:hypothetical protein
MSLRTLTADPTRVLRTYLYVVALGLLAQGVISLALRASGVLPASDTNGLFTGDAMHATMHTVWGIGVLAALLSGNSARRMVVTALVFAAFYISLGILGVVVDDPFGLMLGPRQNGFHLIVGPLALILAVWVLLRRAPAADLSPSLS